MAPFSSSVLEKPSPVFWSSPLHSLNICYPIVHGCTESMKNIEYSESCQRRVIQTAMSRGLSNSQSYLESRKHQLLRPQPAQTLLKAICSPPNPPLYDITQNHLALVCKLDLFGKTRQTRPKNQSVAKTLSSQSRRDNHESSDILAP